MVLIRFKKASFRPTFVWGFTLVEVVIVITILGLTGLVIIDLFLAHNTLFRYSIAEVNTTRSARLALDRILSLIRAADSVEASRSFSGTLYTSGATVLIVRLKTVNTSNDFVPGSYDYIVWYKNNNQLLEIVEAAPTSRLRSTSRQISDRLREISIAYDNSSFPSVKQVTIRLTAQESFRNSSSTITLQSSAKLRNRP